MSFVIEQVKKIATTVVDVGAYRKAVAGGIAGTTAVLAATLSELAELSAESVADASKFGGAVGLVVYVVSNKIREVKAEVEEWIDGELE